MHPFNHPTKHPLVPRFLHQAHQRWQLARAAGFVLISGLISLLLVNLDKLSAFPFSKVLTVHLQHPELILVGSSFGLLLGLGLVCLFEPQFRRTRSAT